MESEYLTDIQKAPFLFLNNHPWDFHTPMKRNLKRTEVKKCDETFFKKTFFSTNNVEYLQNMTKKTVYNNTCEKYIIRPQKHEHMLQIMEYIFEEHAQHISQGQQEQMTILNKLVVDFCVDAIIDEIKARNNYLRDKFALPSTLPDPESTSVAGTKMFAPTLSTKYDDYDIYTPASTPANDIYNQKVIPNSLNENKIHEDYQINYKQCNHQLFD